MDAGDTARLEAIARRIRIEILQSLHAAGAGHVGGPLSAVDLLAALYFGEMRIDPEQPSWPDRDRFILSKGHSSPALYATLAVRGYFPTSELATFDQIDSRLQAHPDMTVLPGLDMSTGSLGQGLSAGLGIALAGRLGGRSYRTFVMLGDGECQEGQVWEAAMVAARYGVDTLVGIVDWNGLQQYGWHDPADPPAVRANPLVAPREQWEAFGWRVIELDGHSFPQVTGALQATRTGDGRPTCLIARTVKGKGVSFMEGNYLWHSNVVSDADLRAALLELG
jgi:transketolase